MAHHHAFSHVKVSGKREYKDNSNRKTRKLGYIERCIIEFSKTHMFIQAAQVAVKYNLDKKRVHDSIKRLERRGIVERVSHGVYRLTRYGMEIMQTLRVENKEIDRHVAGSVGGRRVGVYRVHVYGSDLYRYVRSIYVARKLIDCVLRYVRSVVGVSAFRRIVRGVDVECIDFVLGVHGIRLYRFRELVSIDIVESLGLKASEFGSDVLAAVSGYDIGRMFVKVYGG